MIDEKAIYSIYSFIEDDYSRYVFSSGLLYIEGSVLYALKGATKIIKQQKTKPARGDYLFYFRHYCYLGNRRESSVCGMMPTDAV